MKVTETKLSGCLIIEPEVFGDSRGFFLETFNVSRYKEIAGINLEFVQDNHSRSSQYVLRGLHFQKTKQQGKLVRVIRGEVFDVAVDIRQNSPTFSQWVGVLLSEKNKKQVWIPPGFAHGFLVMSEYADFEYKCTEYYDGNDEGSILWSDPALDIQWPHNSPKLSHKDLCANLLSDLFL
jgi:dTDP-4-dehydrorhamnose 3,5-epimerase